MRDRRYAITGFTLAELLVAMACLALLTAAVVAIWFSFRSNFDHGTSRMELNQRARTTLSRVTPLLSSAAPPNEAQAAIYTPTDGASAQEILFSSTEDWLGGAPFDPRNPSYKLYRLYLQDDVLVLQLYGTDTSRIVARNLYDVTFARDQTTVDVGVTVQGTYRDAKRQETVRTLSQTTVVHVPYYLK